MKKIRSVISLLLVISILSCICLSANATTANISEDNITYLSNGSYIFQVNNKFYYHSLITGENLLLAERNMLNYSPYACYHVPANLLPYWNWYQTDGPYATSVNLITLNEVLESTASWIEVSLALGLAVGLLQILYEEANGNFTTTETVWEIDDGYTYYDDVTYFRIETYFYRESTCRNLIYTDSYTYHG